MLAVKNILEQKGHKVWSVSPDEFVYKALEIMSDHDVGAVLVMDNWKLLGLFSERDYARKLIQKGKTVKDPKVKDYMTKSLVTVSMETDIYECMQLMTKERVRHLPILDNNEVVGIISIGDVVNAIIQDQDMTIQDLKSYISGA